MKITLVSYSDISFLRSQKLLSNSALQFGVNQVLEYNDIWIKQQDTFYKESKHILRNKRGAGYWLWKPFIILDALNKIKNNDILIYVDSGARFINSISSIINILEKKDIFLFYNNGLKNYEWTKRDCFFYMDCDSTIFHNGNQVLAGYIFCKKTEFVMSLIEEWLYYAKDERIITDNSNRCGLSNLSGFKEHRHDQSILSNLAIKYKIELFRDPSQWGNKYKLNQFRKLGEFVENDAYEQNSFLNSHYPTIIDGHRTCYKLRLIDYLRYYCKYINVN